MQHIKYPLSQVWYLAMNNKMLVMKIKIMKTDKIYEQIWINILKEI